MRIKSDFVTNSSSTAFIVSIPNDFYIDQEYALEKFKYHNDPDYRDQDWHETRILGEIEDCIEDLKMGDNIWNYGDEGADTRVFHTISDMCIKQGFVLSIFEMSGEGNSRVQGIAEEDINKWFMNTQLQKLKIEVPDEQDKNS